MDNNSALQNPAAVEEYHCSECMIHVSSAANACPECGEIMWKVSQLKSMGQFFSLFFGVLGIPIMLLMFVLGLVGLLFSIKEGGFWFWFVYLSFFGMLTVMVINVFKFTRRMARDGVFDKKMQKKGARMIPWVIIIYGAAGLVGVIARWVFG